MKCKKILIRVLSIIVMALILLSICTVTSGCAPAKDKVASAKSGETKYEYAMVRLPDGTLIQGTVDHKYTYTSGRIDITIDGVKYSTHFANVAIITSWN